MAVYGRSYSFFRKVETVDDIKGTFKRKSIPSVGKFVIIYIIKMFIGISDIRGMNELLVDYGTMKLIGFTHEKLSNGISCRGKANQYGRRYKRKSGIKEAENSAYIHIALSVMTHAIFYVFLYWRKFRRKGKTQLKRDPINLREFRKQTKLKPDAIFILAGSYYAILSLDEVLSALGVVQRLKIVKLL